MEPLKLTALKDINNSLDVSFNEAKQNQMFCKLCKKLKISEEVLKKNTTKLLDTVEELERCKNCHGLYECKNKVIGHVCYPQVENDKLTFAYSACKFQKNHKEVLENKLTSAKELEQARFKDIDASDLNRAEVIKWILKFYDQYDVSKAMKGLYLHGNFGCGKTYLIAALFNELRLNKKVSAEIVYFPEALRTLKDDWNLFNAKLNYYQTVDLLLIDDIGAEKVSEWGRDEVLGTILQSRMNNNMPTFFTSNLTIDELERHLASSKNNEDIVKARRIIERIKQLTIDVEMLSINRRK